MIGNNKLNYRRNGNNDIAVTNSYGNRVVIPGAQSAHRDKKTGRIIVTTKYGLKNQIDQYCIRHWW